MTQYELTARGARMAAATPALLSTAARCSHWLCAVTVRCAASRGKATLPMAETSGTGTSEIEAAMEYRPRAAGGTSWDRTSWSRSRLTDAGVIAASCDSPYVASGLTRAARTRPAASPHHRQ